MTDYSIGSGVSGQSGYTRTVYQSGYSVGSGAGTGKYFSLLGLHLYK